MLTPISDDDAEQIKAAIFKGHKIDAIKKYREISRAGLKESKDFIEAIESELRLSSPDPFTAPPRGKGCGAAALCLLILIGVAAAFA